MRRRRKEKGKGVELGRNMEGMWKEREGKEERTKRHRDRKKGEGDG